jgi:hypothetical protein
MSNENNLKALNKQWFDRVWNKHERNAIFELIDDDCQIGGLPPSDQSPKEAFATFHDTILAAFDRLTITPEIWAEDGETIVGEGRIQGTHRATNHAVDFRFGYRAVWKEGRIAEADNIIEWHTALTQTNIQTDSSLETLLLPPS